MRLLAFWAVFAAPAVVYLAVQSWRQLTRPTRKSNPFASRSMNVRIDDYLWLPSTTIHQVIDYLQAENDYVERALAPVASLRAQLFEEMKARKETMRPYPTATTAILCSPHASRLAISDLFATEGTPTGRGSPPR